jgi:peptidoglycan-associated lipoprotein
MTRRFLVVATTFVLIVILVGVSACGGKKPPVARATPPPPSSGAPRPPAPPEPVVEPEPVPVPPEPAISSADALANRSLDEINKRSPLQPVFYDFDSAEVSSEFQQVLSANAEVMKKNPTWIISIEGHCDERGTAEYNLALGERRALAVRSYLVSLGLSPDRMRTVSYGKEFPFDPNHNEEAWAKNRRAHFVVTAK